MPKYYSLYSLVIGLLFLACQPKPQQEKKWTIAFSQCVGSDAWRKTMLDEMHRELSFHPEVEFIYADATGDNATQRAQIQALAAKKIDLLIVSPNEAAPLTPIVDSVFQNNIPVVVTDRKTSSGLYNAYVGADNTAIGKLAGQYISHSLAPDARIAIMTGLKGSSATLERRRGLQQVLDSLPSLRMNLELQGDWTRETAYRLAKAHAGQLVQQDVILAFNDQMALGIRQALARMGHPEKHIIGVDALAGTGNGLEEVMKGNLLASLLYPTGGTEAIRTAMAILQKKPYVRDNILGTLVIDKQNAALMLMQSQKIQAQQRDIDKRQILIAEQQQIYRDQQSKLNIVVMSLVLAVVFGAIALLVIQNNRRQNRSLEQQNEEIKSQQQQIVAMSKQVQDASAAKSKFFTHVSHEFKTPLTLILSPLHVLEKEGRLSSDGQEQLLRIKRNALKLQQLVHDLVDIHRREMIKPKLQASAVSIATFLQQLVANFKPLAQEKRIALGLSSKTDIKTIWIDAYLMEQAMSNLIANAIKYTPAQGNITILVEENTFGDFLYVRIIDNGQGISPADIDHVFEQFYQGERHLAGSGVGLAYVKEIVELHHGQVTVSSKLDVGSSFTLRLPTGQQHLHDDELAQQQKSTPPEAAPTEERQVLWTDDADSLSIFSSHKSAGILLVEDQADIRQFLRQLLEKKYNLQVAKSYRQAQEKLEQHLPDLVISDVALADGNGLDLLRELKNSPRFSHIPVLLLSAFDDEENRLRGIRAMADAYIGKPFQVEHLLAVVENLLLSRKQLKDHYAGMLDPQDLMIPGNDAITTADKRFLQHLNLFVEERLADQKLTVEDIAQALNMSRVQLYRKTKNLLQCSINEYILQRRLKKSKFLILEGLHINEIAEKVGFSSATYFAAAFKKQVGQSPTAFKKSALKR